MTDQEKRRELLRSGLAVHFGQMSVNGIKDEDLDEILQDIEGVVPESPPVAQGEALLDPRDGLLTLTFSYKDKVVLPRVDNLGIMTEARLEAALGTIFAEINRARVREYKRTEMMLKQEQVQVNE